MREEAPWASIGGKQTADEYSARTSRRATVQQVVMGEKTLADLFEYMERCYNGQRRHSSLGCLCPLAFERRRAPETLTP